MTAIHWRRPIDGSFTNAADWRGRVVPGASDDAILDGGVSAPYTVTASLSETVNSVQIGSGVTLAVTGGKFTALDSTGSGENAGIILIGAGATFVAEGVGADGTIVNAGTIEIDGAGGGTGRAAFRSGSSGDDLTGGGEIVLGGRGSVLGFTPDTHGFGIIINVDNTIVGSGKISGGIRARLINRSAGLIDANGASPLLVNLYLADYGGLVEATGSGGLNIRSQILRLEEYAVFLAGDGSAIRLDVLEITADGTFKSEGSGVVIASDSGFYAGGVGMTNQADLTLQNCHLGNSHYPFKMINDATVHVAGTLGIGAQTTFEGGGLTDLAGAEIIGIAGAGLTLMSGAITGAGSILGPSQGACKQNGVRVIFSEGTETRRGRLITPTPFLLV